MKPDFNTKIGVACLIYRDNQLLLGQRLNSHGDGTWALPGGHLENGETPFDCAMRETFEETGLQVIKPRIVTWSFDTFAEKQRHYVTLFVRADYNQGEPHIMEPDKCKKWGWYDIDALPQPLFKPLASVTDRIPPD